MEPPKTTNSPAERAVDTAENSEITKLTKLTEETKLTDPTKSTKSTQPVQSTQSTQSATKPTPVISSILKVKQTTSPTEVPKPPRISIPKQTFADFKRKVENQWGGTFRESMVGDLVIKIPRQSVLMRALLNELSITDGKCKDVMIFGTNVDYTIMVEKTKLKDLLGKEEEEDDVLWHLPPTRYTPPAENKQM